MTTALRTRPAAVAGTFYPGDAPTLSADVDAMLADAEPLDVQPKALIVPHAGYIYSGPTAAHAYAQLRPLRGRIRRVVLFGPAHRVPVRGLAAPETERFATPLGTVAVDAEAIERAAGLPHVQRSDLPHAYEHCLEVQLPFLQTVLGSDFLLAPFVIGEATGGEVAAVMEALWGGPETLIVVSSDLSHYHRYTEAQGLDRATVDDILALTTLGDYDQACGAIPINGLIDTARRHGLRPRLLDLRNSGDTAGDRSRVVGYAAIAFSEPGDVR